MCQVPNNGARRWLSERVFGSTTPSTTSFGCASFPRRKSGGVAEWRAGVVESLVNIQLYSDGGLKPAHLFPREKASSARYSRANHGDSSTILL